MRRKRASPLSPELEAFSLGVSRARVTQGGKLLADGDTPFVDHAMKEEGSIMLDHTFRVLVGFDHSTASQEALRLALDQAKEHPLSQVHVLRAIPQLINAMMVPGTAFGYLGFDGVYPRIDEGAHAAHVDLRQEVADICEAWRGNGQCWIEKIQVHTRFDDPVNAILALAEELDVNLVVVGTRARRGIHRLLFGSVAERVMRQSARPVLVAHNKGSDTPAVEAPCHACTEVRFETAGRELWCSRHQEHHTFGRPRHYTSRPLQPDVRTL